MRIKLERGAKRPGRTKYYCSVSTNASRRLNSIYLTFGSLLADVTKRILSNSVSVFVLVCFCRFPVMTVRSLRIELHCCSEAKNQRLLLLAHHFFRHSLHFHNRIGALTCDLVDKPLPLAFHSSFRCSLFALVTRTVPMSQRRSVPLTPNGILLSDHSHPFRSLRHVHSIIDERRLDCAGAWRLLLPVSDVYFVVRTEEHVENTRAVRRNDVVSLFHGDVVRS